MFYLNDAIESINRESHINGLADKQITKTYNNLKAQFNNTALSFQCHDATVQVRCNSFTIRGQAVLSRQLFHCTRTGCVVSATVSLYEDRLCCLCNCFTVRGKAVLSPQLFHCTRTGCAVSATVSLYEDRLCGLRNCFTVRRQAALSRQLFHCTRTGCVVSETV